MDDISAAVKLKRLISLQYESSYSILHDADRPIITDLLPKAEHNLATTDLRIARIQGPLVTAYEQSVLEALVARRGIQFTRAKKLHAAFSSIRRLLPELLSCVFREYLKQETLLFLCPYVLPLGSWLASARGGFSPMEQPRCDS
jgi:hypothetical protein